MIDAIGNKAGKRGAKLRFVRENVTRSVDCVARDEERPEQNKVAEDNKGDRKQTGHARDSCGGAL